MIYYTADLHLGHANVIRHCSHPFANVEEMDEALIHNWNSRPCGEYLESLKGHKHLIVGNHDSTWMKRVDLSIYFESVDCLLTIKDNGRLITMCHYPMMTWPGSRLESYMVYGHIHNNTNADFWPMIRVNPHMLNAGVDVNGFVPVTLEEMIGNNERFKDRNPI